MEHVGSKFVAEVEPDRSRRNSEKQAEEDQMTTQRPISADFHFESRYVEVRGSKIHYVEEGSGDPVLFLHGPPRE